VEADAAIVALARHQHGLVAARQLRRLGLDSRGIARRVARGWLTPRGARVFQVGPLAGPCAREMAALLCYGDRSTVSDGTAAVRWELRPDHGGPVELTIATGVAERPGVRVHRRTLAAADHTVHHGLRITTPARTIADLSPSAPALELQRLIEEAQLKRLATAEELAAYAPGRPALRAALQAHEDPRLTRSEAERRLLELVRAAGLPAPLTNARVAGFEVDVLWPAQRLVVEVDGWAFHGSRAAFERDRSRDARLLAAGYRVLRVTWRQLVETPERVIAVIAAALAAAG
jgi:very-short-patch-repair endonuclease